MLSPFFHLQCLVWSILIALYAASNSKIVLTMDKTHNLNPSNKMHFAKSIFQYHLLSNTSDIPVRSDLIVHANWTKLTSIFEPSADKLPLRFVNDILTINLFEDKAAWKRWMHLIGLGAYVPVTYNNSASPESFEYPLVLKTNIHFGRGVFIVTSPVHLQDLVANITKSGQTYTLEEALTGMGRSEASSYGSVYHGKLLSMRCLKRSFKTETTQKSVERSFNLQHTVMTTSNTTMNNSSLYIMGFAAKPSQQHLLPCSQELIHVTHTMFQNTNYTGPFCSSIKLDQHMRPKMMEINARYCGPMAANEALFVATFVPLAFTAIYNTPRYTELLSGPNKHVFERILSMESTVLHSGGGVFQNKDIVVANFSSTLSLDPITVESYKVK